MTFLRPAVFFDRDGVLNHAVVHNGKPYPPADADSMIIVKDAAETLTYLKTEGYILICVTNQPDVARGARSMENVVNMNRKVRDSLPLDDLLTCFHDNADECDCRKPKPGMLLDAAAAWHINLKRSWMIGDRASDIAAGRAAGCRTIFLDMKYAEDNPEPPPDFVCAALGDVVKIIKRGAALCQGSVLS